MQKALIGLLADGPFTTSQAARAGVPRWLLERAANERIVRRVLRGVYVDAAIPDTNELRLAAVSTVARSGLVIWRRTASWIKGIDVFHYAELEILPPLELAAEPAGNRVRLGVTRGSRIGFAPHHVETVGSLRVTTDLRTACDLGRLLPRGDAICGLDAFLRHTPITREELWAESEQLGGYRGIRQFRELIPIADGLSESPGESRTRLAIIDAGLPIPQSQIVVMHNGRELFRLDLGYEKHRVCVEYDGVETHSSDEQRAHDLRRRDWLRDHGWIVIVVRKGDLTRERIAIWTQELRDALASRQARG